MPQKQLSRFGVLRLLIFLTVVLGVVYGRCQKATDTASIGHAPPAQPTIVVPVAPVTPNSAAQVTLQSVVREWSLLDRLKETQNESARMAIRAEIDAVRQRRQSLYQRLRKEEQQ